MGEVKREVDRAARSTWARWLARLGLVAKGATFGLVGLLAIRVAIEGSGKVEDRPGALEQIAQTGYGRFLLAALAVGLGGYAIWRFIEAAVGRTLETGEEQSALKRVGLVARGLFYAWLSVMSAALVFSADEPVTGGGGGGSAKEDRATRIALEHTLGRYLVIAVGLAILGASLFNLVRALTRKFRKDLKEQQMGSQERRWYTALGVVGHLARAVIFALIGIFLIRAAWEYDPKEAIGFDGALSKLAHAEYGPVLLGVVAAGLISYGLFCLVQARYREV
jgi:Domain of Unknown Function (DUF1206)